VTPSVGDKGVLKKNITAVSLGSSEKVRVRVRVRVRVKEQLRSIFSLTTHFSVRRDSAIGC